MSIEQLQALRNSPEAPFDHMAYTIWLHNKIIDDVTYKIWGIRESGNTINTNGYVVCNKILASDALKQVK